MLTDIPEVADNPEFVAAADLFRSIMLERYFENAARWLDAKAKEPAEWQQAAQFNDRMLYLTAAELEDVAEQIETLLDTYSDRTINPALRPADSRLVSCVNLGFPLLDRKEIPPMRNRIPDLLRETVFRRYWSAQTISMFGDQISSIALPLVAVLALHANAAQMGFLAALEWLPSLMFGLHAGALVDRRGRRRQTMITADLGRAALLISIPVCYAAGVLTLWQLYGVAFGVGTLSILFVVSDPAIFVSLVPEDKYVNGQSLVYGSRAISFVGGPSVGGILVQLLSAPGAVLADALSFLGSAFFLARIRPAGAAQGRAGQGHAHGRRQVHQALLDRPLVPDRRLRGQLLRASSSPRCSCSTPPSPCTSCRACSAWSWARARSAA